MSRASHVVLVTGGASGIGQLTALRLARAGATVAILDLNEEGLARTATGAANITSYVCDVSDLSQVKQVVGAVEQSLGPVKRLVHCAAIMPGRPLRDMSATEIMRVMNINYGGTVNMTMTLLPLMEGRGGGEIVLYGSMAGDVLTHNLGAYCATKSATHTFAEILVHESRKSPVRILLVCPPMVDTPLIEQAIELGPNAMKLTRSSPSAAKHVAKPEEIVDAVDAALLRGDWVVRPKQAATLVRVRRFFPGLLWWVMSKANQ